MVADMYGGHIISPNDIELTNVGFYIAVIDLEVVVTVEDDLWRAIYIEGAANMARVSISD